MNLLSHTMRDHAGQASDTLRIIQKRQAARTTIVDIVVQWNMQAAWTFIKTGCTRLSMKVYLQEALGLRIHSSKAVWHELHHCSSDGFITQLHIIQKLLGHTASPSRWHD